jgi:hypothetical protein
MCVLHDGMVAEQGTGVHSSHTSMKFVSALIPKTAPNPLESVPNPAFYGIHGSHKSFIARYLRHYPACSYRRCTFATLP